MADQPPPPGWAAPGSAPPAASGPAPGHGPPPGHGAVPDYGPPPHYAFAGPPVHKPGVVALRPLGLGDMFDGAFRTIRRNPRSMLGLAALVTTVFMVVPVLMTLGAAAAGALSVDLTDTGDDSALVLSYGSSALGDVFGFFATVVLTGMLVHVVAEAVLGRRTGIGEAWSATRGRLLRLLGLTVLTSLALVLVLALPVGVGVLVGLTLGLWQGLLVGVPLFLVGVVAAVFLQVRYVLLAAPSLVLERIGVVASLRRAAVLSRGQFWRLFGVLLLTTLVTGLVSEVLSVPLNLVGGIGTAVAPGTGGALILVFSHYLSQILVGTVTTPFASAVVALQYVDQRIRKEGLDVQLIAAAAGRPPGTR
jgi:hypothetical protein